MPWRPWGRRASPPARRTDVVGESDAATRAAALVAEAAGLWGEPERAGRLLREARRLAPDLIDVQVALYRFHFYRGEVREALAVADECIGTSAATLGLPADWREVTAGGADFGDLADPARRFYLFALKAWGYLQMRTGNLDAGAAALAAVRRLDPQDRVGSGVLQQVLDRHDRPDEDD